MPLDRHPPRRLCALLGQALPALGLHLCDAMPSTPSGKIQKFKLRELQQAGELTEL